MSVLVTVTKSSQITVRHPAMSEALILTFNYKTAAGNMPFIPLDMNQITRCHLYSGVFIKSQTSSHKQSAA